MPNKDDIQKLSNLISEAEINKHQVYKAMGCEDCLDTGYRGLCGVYECLKFDPPIVRALAESDFDGFRKEAFQQIKGNTLGDNIAILSIKFLNSLTLPGQS